MTAPASTAIDDPWVNDVLRRTRRSGLLQLGAGLVMFILVGVAANVVVGRSERLRQSGGEVPGVIVEIRGLSATSDSTAVVDYAVDGRQYEQQVDLGNHRAEFHADERVTVYYDTGHPSTMTIDDLDNQPGWTVLPMVVAFVAGLGLMAMGTAALISTHRRRRLLRAHPWRDDATLLGASGTGLYLTLPDGPLLRAWRSAKAPAPDPAVRVRLVTGEHGALVALGDTPDDLLKARPPRSHREEQGWRRLLEATPP